MRKPESLENRKDLQPKTSNPHWPAFHVMPFRFRRAEVWGFGIYGLFSRLWVRDSGC